MINYKQWNHRKYYNEFVGPSGQIDPQGIMPNNIEAPEAVEPERLNSKRMLDRTLHSLKSKSGAELLQAQRYFNNHMNELLKAKSSSTARRGLWQGFNDFKTQRQEFGSNQ